jgi:hypothetical protein
VTDFVSEHRERNVPSHIAVDAHLIKTGKTRKTAIDGRTTRHPGYAISRRIRKRIEEGFGYIKTVAVLRKTRHRGTARVSFMFTLTAAAYNLVRIPKLLATTPQGRRESGAPPRMIPGKGHFDLHEAAKNPQSVPFSAARKVRGEFIDRALGGVLPRGRIQQYAGVAG